MNMTRRLGAIFLFAAVGAHTGWSQSNPFTITPSPIVLCGQPDQVTSAVPVTITTAGAPVTFTVTSITSDGNWLDVFPALVTTSPERPGQLLVGVNGPFIPLANGDYTAQIVLGGLDGAKLATIPVSLHVSAAGCGSTRSGSYFVNSGPLTFQLPAGLPTTGNTDVRLVFNTYRTNLIVAPMVNTSAGQNWLTTAVTNLNLVTGTVSPTPLGVGIGTEHLTPGTYTGNIELDSSNGATLFLPVTLNVTGAAAGPRLLVTPSPVSIGVARGTVTTSLNLELTNLASTPVTIAPFATTASNRAWLQVTPPSSVVLPNSTIDLVASITGAGLADGPNTATINVQVTSGSGGVLTIPVTVNYGLNSEISVTPDPVNIVTPPGASNPTTAVVSVSAASSSVPFTVNAFSSVNQPWLSVTPSSAITTPGKPVNLTISVLPTALPLGPAVGIITLKRNDGSTLLTIPVNVNSGRDTTATVTPAQLSFTYATAGAIPLAQSLSLTSSAGTSYSVQTTTSTGGNWLAANPVIVPTATTGAAAANITVQVNPTGLPPNTYQGQVILTNTASGAQQTVPVALTVIAPVSVSASPAALTFRYTAGSSAVPVAQNVQVVSNGGSTRFTATTAGVNGAPDFLTLPSFDGATPGTLLVGLNPLIVSTLGPGEYNGILKISIPGAGGGDQMVSVALVVSPPSPRVQSVVNAASLVPGAISPGEIVTIFGSDLGPALGSPFALTAQGTVPTVLGGVNVSFDGIAAPLLYAGAQQINAIVPYEIAGRAVTQLGISRNGVISSPLVLQVMDTAPAIFSATQNGNGQGAILNADNSYNGPANPAKPGSVIQIFATGEGLYFGAATASVTPTIPPFPTPISAVSVTIGGQPAQIQYAAEAPGLISGMLQVNAVVPEGTGPGPQQLAITIGKSSNVEQTVTVVVQ